MIIMAFLSKWVFKDLAVRFDISKETTQRDGCRFSNCSEELELIYEEWIKELNIEPIEAELNILD